MADPTDTISTENVVASMAVDQELNLEVLAEDLRGTRYEPGRFPGLVYRSDEPKSVALIFRLGKVVITGQRVKPPRTRPSRTCSRRSTAWASRSRIRRSYRS